MMALAYSPGIKVKAFTAIKRVRRLSVKGKVLVNEGSDVRYDAVVATSTLPGDVEILRIRRILNIDSEELEGCMVKKIGDRVEKGEIIAKKASLFGLSKAEAKSPIPGTIERISPVTGQITIRHDPVSINLTAYLPGKISHVFPEEGVEITTQGAYIQGIFGLGGETHGELQIIAEPGEDITAEKISSAHEGKILAGGAMITNDALKKAVSNGVRGLVVGGIEIGDLVTFMGQELGVAITGHENLGTTLLITEGFGRMKMAARTFSLIKGLQGKIAAMNGATQIRAGVIRPELFVPALDSEAQKRQDQDSETQLHKGMQPGMRVRIIRKPYFGAIGTIVALPAELQNVETESPVRVMEIDLEEGGRVIVPRANVEIMEE